MLSSKYPPFYYIAAGFWQMLLGVGPDRATSVNILFQGVLVFSTYGLGRSLLGPAVGVWAAALTLLFPSLYALSLDFLFDYPLVAMVTASFFCLTLWRLAATRQQGWWRAIAFGVVLGLSLLTKHPAAFFFVVPVLWLAIARLWQRRWEACLQLGVGLSVAAAIAFPWVRTNWIFLGSTWQNANLASAAAEGDPSLDTLAAWTYYFEKLPQSISWPLLVVPAVGALLAAFGLFGQSALSGSSAASKSRSDALLWLGGFCFGAYLLWSAISNKDLRYIVPYLPVISIFLAVGLLCWPRRYRLVRWLTVLLAALLMACNLFPVGGGAGQWLADRLAAAGRFPIETRADWPQAEIVAHIAATSPHQLSTVGVLPPKPWLNQYNINYEGARANFQVYGRNLGHRDRLRDRDFRHTDWFLSLTDPESAATSFEDLKDWQRSGRLLADEPDFQLERTWQVLGDRQVSLYRRRELPVTVEPLAEKTATQPIRLARVTVPEVVPAGAPVPVTYVWEGEWDRLCQGRVLLTWVSESEAASAYSGPNRWLHDRGIGLGTLRPGPIQANQFTQSPALVDGRREFRVTERTAMLPAGVAPGTYTLQATYLDDARDRLVPLQVPPVSLRIDPAAPAVPAPPLDFVTQMRQLATGLPEGVPALEGIFADLERLNLYDPIQNFYVQAEDTLALRLRQEPENLDYAYGLLLARVMQRKIDASLAVLETIVALDRQNPYSHAYQAFVNLVAWRPGPAKRALRPALALAPDSAEIKGLDAVASLMGGNLWGAWQQGRDIL